MNIKNALTMPLSFPNQNARGDWMDRLFLRWPPKIRREIGEWFGGALCGHGSQMSKPAMRRWRYFLEKLELQNEKLVRK